MDNFLQEMQPAFSVPGKTQPGHTIETQKFKIEFTGVLIDDCENELSRSLEHLYDWSDLMRMVLEATEHYEDVSDIELLVEDDLRDWLCSYRGWGLVSNILPSEQYRHFLMALIYTSTNWVEATGGPRTGEKVFNAVKYIYDHIPGKELSNIVPDLAVMVEDMELESPGGRKKSLSVYFNIDQTDIEVMFILEKKRINDNLVDMAAEIVSKTVRNLEDLEKLEVPRTLMVPLKVKFKDMDWIRRREKVMECDNRTKSKEEFINKDTLNTNYVDSSIVDDGVGANYVTNTRRWFKHGVLFCSTVLLVYLSF